MKLQTVNIDEIVPNEYNPNKLTPTEYRNLIFSLEEYGQVVPLLVRSKNGNGKYVLIDGEHRQKAMYELNMDKVDILIYEKKEDEEKYKMLTIALDEFRGSIDRDIVMKILDSTRDETRRLLERMKLIETHRKFDEIEDFASTEVDWEDSRIYNVDKEFKDYFQPFTVSATEGEIKTMRDFQNVCTGLDVTMLKAIWEYVSSREIDDDEYFFLAFQLALKRALTTRMLPFRDNPEKPLSIVYRDKQENVEKVVEFIKSLTKKSTKSKK